MQEVQILYSSAANTLLLIAYIACRDVMASESDGIQHFPKSVGYLKPGHVGLEIFVLFHL